jgi:hypothetical protein
MKPQTTFLDSAFWEKPSIDWVMKIFNPEIRKGS